jgi:predicted extracellular nuclease
MKMKLGFALMVSCASTMTYAADDLFFSEYIEGSSNNKALEIFNGTGSSVDLSAYEVQMYFNGNTTAGLTLALSGNISENDVFVLAQSNAGTDILAQADLTSSSGWFNGDDAILLLKGGVAIDSIGQIGVDPGSAWGTSDISTQNKTLRRAPSVEQGDNNPTDSFEPSLEWIGFPIDSFDDLGKHNSVDDPTPPGCETDCTPPVVSACGDPATYIHAIQGIGFESPLIGSLHTIEAIVVGDFQASGELSGFFIQEEDGDTDANAQTSEGLFVYHRNDDVNIGDVVRVTGTVGEYFGMTQLSSIKQIEVCSSGASITAAELILPVSNIEYLESIEGMKVVTSQSLTVSENYNLGRYGELVLSNGRLFNPTNIAEPGAAAIAAQSANMLNRIILDDGSRAQNPDPIIHPTPGLSAVNTVRGGDLVSGIEGVLEFAFSEYRIQPTNNPTFLANNPRTNAPALPGIGSLSVASFNVLNYFNGDGLSGGFPTARGADTLEELERQQDKIVNALIAMNADIVGLMELENDGYNAESAIASLVDALNSAGGDYAFVNSGLAKIGTDAITVGLIYRTSKVAMTGETRILDSSINPLFIDDKNRPALIQSFRELASNGVLTVAVNHLKSKGSDCDALGDPDTGDGQGNCNVTRTNAAKALVDFLAQDPTQSGDADVLVIGDLNAYAKEEPIDAIKNAGYLDLIQQHIGDQAYSYVFFGQAGSLDHALASESLSSQVTGVVEWHINADEPRVLDYNTEFKSANQVADLYSSDPYRASDHDPIIVEFNLRSSLKGDFNENGRYDLSDFLSLIFHLRCSKSHCEKYDLNSDGKVNFKDIKQWYRLYRESLKD